MEAASLKEIVRETTKTTRTTMSAIRLNAGDSRVKKDANRERRSSLQRASKFVDRESRSDERALVIDVGEKSADVLAPGACLGRYNSAN